MFVILATKPTQDGCKVRFNYLRRVFTASP